MASPYNGIVITLSNTSLIDPPADDAVAPTSPQGTTPLPFSWAFSQVPQTPLAGGSVRIVDSSTFKIATTIAAAEVTVEPGAMR